MKYIKLFFIVAILGAGFFISFTPEQVEAEQSQRLLVPRQG